MANYLVSEESLKQIADCIRTVGDTTAELTFPDGFVSAIENLEPQTYILTDSSGNEIPAVLVETATVFDATPNDIRKGKTAVTDVGVTVGEKEIPAYHTTEGIQVIEVGEEYIIELPANKCEYTKLQALICAYNTSLSDSVATEKVSIDGYVYPVNSTESIADITVDTDNNAINLGISNEGETPCLIRYFTYKEEI